MTFTLIYWVLMLFWLVFSVWRNYPLTDRLSLGGSVLEFILFFILGWAVFGPPIRG